MAILSTPSKAFPISLVYITLGTLIDIWSILSLIYYPPETPWGHYLVVGLIVTGLALLIIGILLGQIGRAARHAELPPAEVTPATASATQKAAEHPPVVMAGAAPGQAAAPILPANGTPPPAPPIAQQPAAAPIQRR